jgi:ABC-type transport system involved in cytochrome bd biosynthesis fused ATPase/permease subunit
VYALPSNLRTEKQQQQQQQQQNKTDKATQKQEQQQKIIDNVIHLNISLLKALSCLICIALSVG